MKRKNLKNCKSFKPINISENMHNTPITSNCSHCMYFSSKNCHLEASNDLEPDVDFL